MSDPDPQSIPGGYSCRHCANWQRCSSLIFSLTGNEEWCDWSPSRFMLDRTSPPPVPVAGSSPGSSPGPSLVGRRALVPIFGKRRAVTARIIAEGEGPKGDLVIVEVLGGAREEKFAGFRRRQFHPSHLSLLKSEVDQSCP